MSMPENFPAPRGGASLILSFRMEHKTTLVIGGNPLAASRAFSALEAESQVVVLARGSPCAELQWRASQGQILLCDLDSLVGGGKRDDAQALEKYLSDYDTVSLVCITDTLSSSPDRRTKASAAELYHVCRKYRIPANITDYPDFCDFSFTSTHRFVHHGTGEVTSLQIGVTTNGQGCRLSGRIRREVVSRLPREVGAATSSVGQLRSLAKSTHSDEEGCEESTEEPTPNNPVPQRSSSETASESARRRMKWVAQVSEYWPLSKLANMTNRDIEGILTGEQFSPLVQKSHIADSKVPSLHDLSLSSPRNGRIFLIGSGPGHPSLLTIAAHNALIQLADLVLSDKLVPTEVLALIPSTVGVQIARKFPGNAEGAQQEMQDAAVEAAKRGLTVVRLKQGDPTVYGRAGEEILYFRSHGFEPIVIPGVSSALAGPVFAGIPVTQRGAAESFVVCTGVGKGGKEVRLPGYDRGRTLVILMGVARLTAVLDALQMPDLPLSTRAGAAYPPRTPIAIIERASMSDQRVVSSTLRDIGDIFAGIGEQRPPGMIVVGWSVVSLWGKGDMRILDEGAELDDEQRIRAWLENKSWRVQEGLDDGWTDL